jgi:sugar phosphate isomerase/epimerase
MASLKRLRIGISLEALGLPLRRALQEVERLGVAGVQVDAVGDLSPDALSQTGRRELRHLLRAHGLELTALACPLRRGLDVAEGQEARIDHLRKVMSLSFDLGPRIVVVEAGQVPESADDPRARLLAEALLALGQHGDRTGATLALATGLESGTTLRSFLDRFDTGSLGVNLDPAGLLLNGFDPCASTRELRGKIVHMHATDARAAKVVRTAQRAQLVAQVPLGHGDIDWLSLVSVLEEVEYRGWVVASAAGNNRLAEVASGVAFLRRLIGQE